MSLAVMDPIGIERAVLSLPNSVALLGLPSVAHKLIERRPCAPRTQRTFKITGNRHRRTNCSTKLKRRSGRWRQIAKLFSTPRYRPLRGFSTRYSHWYQPQLLLGTHFPFGQEIGLRYTVRGIVCHPCFSDDDRAGVLGGNASRLLSNGNRLNDR